MSVTFRQAGAGDVPALNAALARLSADIGDTHRASDEDLRRAFHDWMVLVIRDQQVAFAEMFGQNAGKPQALAVRKRNLEHVATKIEHACHGHRHPGIGACPQRGVETRFHAVHVCYQPRDEHFEISREQAGGAHCRADCQRQEPTRG